MPLMLQLVLTVLGGGGFRDMAGSGMWHVAFVALERKDWKIALGLLDSDSYGE